jgi:CBS domain containing-hemolysin-like protein
MPSYIPILLMVIGLLFSSFFSSSEITYTAVNQSRLEVAAKNGDNKAKKALQIAQKFDGYSSALLFGNGLVNIMSSTMAALISIEVVAPLLNGNEALASLLMAIGTFLLIVIFGEIMPKMISRNYSFLLSRLYVRPVTIVRYLFSPIVLLVSLLVRSISWTWQGAKKRKVESFSDDELETMVDSIEEDGLIDEKKGDLIRSAISFSSTKAYEIMTPRVDVLSFNLEDDPDDLLHHLDTFSFSRLPVYDGTIDKIIGILPTKRLYPYLINKEKPFIESLLIEPLFIPRTFPIQDALNLFKESKRHMAIVVDEHGGTEGILTVEDVVEEIVGEIWDETDDILDPIIQQNDTTYLVEGSVNIEDLFDLLELDLPEHLDYATVSGWVLDQIGQFASVGDHFTYESIKIEVLQVDQFTVEKIKVTLPQFENSTEED